LAGDCTRTLPIPFDPGGDLSLAGRDDVATLITVNLHQLITAFRGADPLGLSKVMITTTQ
jgi:hypothetical protein